MSRDEEKSVLLSVLAGIGLGAIIGAASGLLFAPKAGSETREDLKKAADDLKNRADEVMGEIGESVDEIVARSKDLIETTKTKVQSAIESGKQAIAEKKDELKAEVESKAGE